MTASGVEPSRVLAQPGESASLVDAIAAGAPEVAGLALHHLCRLEAGDRTERAITVDQTNQSVVVGERVVVKWLRPGGSGRAAATIPALVAAGFARMPATYSLAFRAGVLAAIVTEYLPGASDGWDWCVQAVLEEIAGGAPADFAGDLGVLAADLHAALATPTSVAPRPVREILNPGWAEAGLIVLRQALALSHASGGTDDAWLAERADRLAADIATAADVERANTIPPHGDLHVGQVLRWRDGYAVVDFDGNPTLTVPDREPLARDLAQLRTSLLHVGQIADRRSGGASHVKIMDWARTGQDALLDGYTARLAELGLDQLFQNELLRPFEVEQECRELIYAARYLPRWRYAPMGVLRTWYA